VWALVPAVKAAIAAAVGMRLMEASSDGMKGTL
jgi:hypothetical protein